MSQASTAVESLRAFFRPVYRPLKRSWRLLQWVVSSAAPMVRTDHSTTRILVVYDTSTQPFSIGDLIVLQVAAMMLCKEHGAESTDVALVFDPEQPVHSKSVFSSVIDADNVFYHLASIIPVVQINPHLGSVFLFNSHPQLNAHVTENWSRYIVWPTGWDLSSREYLSPLVFNQLLRAHHARFGSVPQLTCRPFLRDWAASFYASHAAAKVAISVNLRSNPRWGAARNSSMEAWLDFFAHCADRYPVVFVVICALSEVDERLRAVPNVVVAKDQGTSIEQDLALISTSAMHLGADSGPATMAWFGRKPYLLVNTSFEGVSFFGSSSMVQHDREGHQRLWFAAPHQRAIPGTETAALLIREFETTWPLLRSSPADMTTAVRASELQSSLR